MQLLPLTLSQIRQAEDGSWIEIDATSGSTLSELQKIDKGFRARLKITDVPRGKEFFAVYHINHDGCPHNKKDDAGRDLPNGSTYLVSKWQATPNRSGTWEGLDRRAVDRIMQIGHTSYDYAKALEDHNRKVETDRRKQLSEERGETLERAAHAIRKDQGTRYQGRAFVPRNIKES